jgi:hypothetical protein
MPILVLILLIIPTLASSKSPSFLPQQRTRKVYVVPTRRTIQQKPVTGTKKASTIACSTHEQAWVTGFKNSLASALAAGCSKLILAPFDTIKTLQQHSRTVGSTPLTLYQAAQVIMNRPKGFVEFYVS